MISPIAFGREGVGAGRSDEGATSCFTLPGAGVMGETAVEEREQTQS
jgi:hypothetical protein